MIRVQAEDFDIGAELKRLSAGRLGVGGLATFTGLVREQVEGGQLVAMTLEHYPGMTERMLQKIEEEARRRWPLDDCLIIHRIGSLMPGDQIVLVACSSAHRQAALEACAFLIDWLKTDAPFWKKEELNDQSRWVEAKTSDDAARGRWQKSGKV